MKHAARLRRLEALRKAAPPPVPPILLERPDGTLAAACGGPIYADRAEAVRAWPDRPGAPSLCIIRLATAADLSAPRKNTY